MSSQVDSNWEEENEVRVLLEEKERLTTEGKYLEAESIRGQIAKHKQRAMSQKLVTLKEYQLNEKEELDEQFTAELKTLKEFWDEKISAYEKSAQSLEDENKAQRGKNIEALITMLNDSYKPMKFSKEYLECKTMEINLAKREKYKEAQYYKLKCERIEREMNEKHSKDKAAYAKTQVEAYEVKLEADMKNLQDRFKVNLSLLRNQKQKEVEKLEKKFKNRRRELEDIHLMQNKISLNENHLRAKVTANRISTLMRTTSKSSKSNTKKAHAKSNTKKAHAKYSQNHTNHSEVNVEDNTRQLPLMMGNSNEFTLNFLDKNSAREEKGCEGRVQCGEEKDNGYLQVFVDVKESLGEGDN